MRPRTPLALASLAIILTGCSPAPQQSPSTPPSPTSTSISASPSPSAGPETDGDDLTDEILADLCIEKTRSYYASDVEFFPNEVRIESRTVDPPWLVIVPARSLGLDHQSVCTIGGTASEPVFEAHAATEPMTEQEIQDAINGVEHYDGEGE